MVFVYHSIDTIPVQSMYIHVHVLVLVDIVYITSSHLVLMITHIHIHTLFSDNKSNVKSATVRKSSQVETHTTLY